MPINFKGVLRDDGEEILRPYSGPGDPDLPDSVQALSERLREIWVNVFNSAYSSCIADGGNTADCEGSAFAQAWSVVNQNR